MKIQGYIVSNKMQKTVSVLVETMKLHPLYKKRFKRSKKYLADTNNFNCQIGDLVEITSTRPISKRKKWKVTKIISPAENLEANI